MLDMNKTKIPIKVIQEVVKEQIPKVNEIVKLSGTNTWFFKFANSEDMTDEVYSKLNKLSFKIEVSKELGQKKSKEFNRKYKNIMAKLDLTKVNTYYERQIRIFKGEN